MNSERRARSLVKMIAYRIVVFALLAAVTYYFTGNAGQTTVISVVFNVAGSAVYYVYERLWDVIPWGKEVSTVLIKPRAMKSLGEVGLEYAGDRNVQNPTSSPPPKE